MFVCICTINEKVKIVVGALHYNLVNETILIVFHSVLNPTTSFSFQTVYSDNSRSVSSTVSKHCNTTPASWLEPPPLCCSMTLCVNYNDYVVKFEKN